TALDVKREGGSCVVTLPTRLAAGDSATITIAYKGKPHVAMAPPWFGGFVWSEVNGTPWFATAVQGDGCDLWWPCKDNFADKPDNGVDLAISAPKGVKIASVGLLTGMDEGSDGFDTWHWRSRHPYSGYAVAINGGPYELIEEEYAGINGTSYPIQFWALKDNAEKARALVSSDVIPDLAFFERLLGPYPWGDEKAGFVETPHLGMEHQTINGYGEQYKRGRYGFDGLLHHELAHEWFGNVMTHARPEDAWLHEGYGAYMQAVYAEETVGAMGYFDVMYGAYTNNEHCLPVANPAVEDAGEAFDNRDIYTKGSWMLHSLRRYIGEEAFWAGTRRVLYDTAEPWSLPYPIQSRYRSTEDFIEIMSDEAGEDIAWIVETYLREAGMPELLSTRTNGQLSLSWTVPGNRAFPMPVEVSINDEITVVDMSSGPQLLSVAHNARVLIDPQSKILRSLPIIGDCSEQTDEQIQNNIERFTRMAKDYGWQRN
ncbi:MAG: M1 family metallopeptidase, partial [Congregibacter sp.]|nr:M1 family metallopeptidase [Congregibacter sp.]